VTEKSYVLVVNKILKRDDSRDVLFVTFFSRGKNVDGNNKFKQPQTTQIGARGPSPFMIVFPVLIHFLFHTF